LVEIASVGAHMGLTEFRINNQRLLAVKKGFLEFLNFDVRHRTVRQCSLGFHQILKMIEAILTQTS
jgi:hypothetical protein